MFEQYRRQVGWMVRAQVDKATRHAIDSAVTWGRGEVERRFFATATIESTDEAFLWLNTWLGKHPQLQGARKAKVTTIEPYEDDEDDDLFNPETETERRRKTELVLAPAEGTHRIRYQGSLIWVTRKIEKGPPRIEKFEIRMVAKDSSLLRDLLTEARDMTMEGDHARPQVRVMTAQGSYWRHAALQPARPAGSVILPGDQYERLEDDIRKFFSRRAKYASLGIPFRRGYLLHGLPGTGKSSTLLGLASRFNLHLHMLNLSNPMIDDAALTELLAQVNEGSAIVMEDVDALWEQRKRKKDNESSVTFSGLLNALDGVAAGQGRVVFMTTNHLVKLDPALTRPGRVDYRLEFGPATADQAARLFSRFYEHQADPEVVGAFADRAADGQAVMSDLQEFLIGYFDDPDGAAREIADYLPEARAQKAREAAGRARAAKKVKEKHEDEEQAVVDFAGNLANWSLV